MKEEEEEALGTADEEKTKQLQSVTFHGPAAMSIFLDLLFHAVRYILCARDHPVGAQAKQYELRDWTQTYAVGFATHIQNLSQC